MKPVFQTMFGSSRSDDDAGNCMQACVASILELPLEEVPHFVKDGGKHDNDWWYRLKQFLATRNLCPVAFDAKKHPYSRYGATLSHGHYLIGGTTVRGTKHGVVGLDGAIVHDPHPDGAGIEDVISYTVLVSLDDQDARECGQDAGM